MGKFNLVSLICSVTLSQVFLVHASAPTSRSASPNPADSVVINLSDSATSTAPHKIRRGACISRLALNNMTPINSPASNDSGPAMAGAGAGPMINPGAHAVHFWEDQASSASGCSIKSMASDGSDISELELRVNLLKIARRLGVSKRSLRDLSPTSQVRLIAQHTECLDQRDVHHPSPSAWSNDFLSSSPDSATATRPVVMAALRPQMAGGATVTDYSNAGHTDYLSNDQVTNQAVLDHSLASERLRWGIFGLAAGAVSLGWFFTNRHHHEKS